MYKYTLVLISLLMIGCGSSKKTIYIGKGQYIDAPVKGMQYQCGSEHGKTDDNGYFYYEQDKECEFYLGNYSFTKVDAKYLNKNGVKINVWDFNTLKTARLLQTLDIDGDASNGIELVEDEAESILKISDLEDDSIKKLVKFLKADLSEYSGKYITLDEAQEHIEKSKNGSEALVPKITVSDSVTQGDTIFLSAKSSKGDIKKYIWYLGNTKLGEGVEFEISSNIFNLGSNEIKLTVVDSDGKSNSITKSLIVKPKPTAWDSAFKLYEKDGNRLLVRDDESNIYFKFISKNLSKSDIEKLTFYINSDNDLYSGAGEKGYDYRLGTDGMFKLMDKEDYNGIKVQNLNTLADNSQIVYTIKKSNIEYLAKEIEIVVYNGSKSIFGLPNSYKVTNYTQPVDNVGPVISLDTKGLQKIPLHGVVPTINARAYDVGDKADVEVSIDASKVDLSKAGYYVLYFHALDSKNNRSTKTLNIQVGTPSENHIIEKKMGDLNESVIIQKGLVWANDDTTSIDTTRGCLIVGEDEDSSKIKERFENYCENSNYAGFTDWRVPTALEMSRYTIQMLDESRTPGMARKNCSRTLALDSNGALMAVRTHNTMLPGTYEYIIKPSGGRCVRGSVDNSTSDLNLTKIKGGYVMEQKSKKLMWVSEFDTHGTACLAIHHDKPSEYDTSKNFCKNLDFAGFNDWRDPTSLELKSFVLETKNSHIIPGYQAPCKKLLARDDENGTIVEKEVYTRFSTKIGEIKDLNLSTNIGLRCVRDE